MKIHGFHDHGACGRIRVLLPLHALRDLGGHEVTTSQGWDSKNPEIAQAARILIAERIMKYEGVQLWRELAPGRSLVFETDDDIWTVDRTNPDAHRFQEVGRGMTQLAIDISDMVQVSTPYLAEVIWKQCQHPNIVVLPNCIDAAALEVKRTRRDKLVVGWAGGSSHALDLFMIAATLKRFLHQHPEAEFHNVGTNFKDMLKLKGRFSDWQPDLFDYYRTLDFDIALAPLGNFPFNRSKSGIKAIEAMALGIPVIASDLEPYQMVIEHGVTGFLCRQPHEWMRYLRLLAGDAKLREEMGQAGKASVAARWTIQNEWRRWEQAYESISKIRQPVGGVA